MGEIVGCGDEGDAMAVATTTVGLTDLKFRLVREDFAEAPWRGWPGYPNQTDRARCWPACC